MKKSKTNAAGTATLFLMTTLGVVGCGSGNSSTPTVPTAGTAATGGCLQSPQYPNQCLTACASTSCQGYSGVGSTYNNYAGYTEECVTVPNSGYCQLMEVTTTTTAGVGVTGVNGQCGSGYIYSSRYQSCLQECGNGQGGYVNGQCVYYTYL